MSSPLRSARDRARSEVRSAILDKAREHLAVEGAAGLSLRAVARDLGLVSSAVYRYFANRDALLTALIVDAYDSLGDATDAAVAEAAGRPAAQRWVAGVEAVRTWASAHLQEYALLYGSPVPGYAAPDDTVVPGTRVSIALVQVVRDAYDAGAVAPGATLAPGPVTTPELERLAGLLGTTLPAPVLFAALLAWTQLFGLLTFELFGQTRGIVDDHAAFFHDAAAAMAAHIGL